MSPSAHVATLRPGRRTRRPTAEPHPRVEVTDPAVGPAARRLVARLVRDVARRVDLDRPGASAYRVLGAGGAPVGVDGLTARLVEAALEAARTTGGLVDPTVGAAVLADRARRAGLDVAARTGTFPVCSAWRASRPRPAPGAVAVRLDGRRLSARAGVVLDLSATADAVLAAAAARTVAARLRTGVLVEVGGDVAQAGPAPADGRLLHLPDGGTLRLAVGLAASTVRPRPGQPVVDPRTGAAVDETWVAVTVLHPDPLTAKAFALAAAVLADGAAAFLDRQGVDYRLVADGAVVHSAGSPSSGPSGPAGPSDRLAVAS